MNNIRTKLAAVVLVLSAVPAYAGKGGSAALIAQAISSNSQDAIIAEVERTEGLMCSECVQLVTNLTADSRYPVREVAAWWFAKRPGLKDLMVAQMKDNLLYGDATAVRDAADFLGAVVQYDALPSLQTALARGGLTTDAKLAIVHAVGFMAHVKGNPVLQAAMADSDAAVRAAAIGAWRDILGQVSVTPVEPMLADSAANVRAQAATVLGAYGDANARTTLEQLVMHDPDSTVRRNAAWALGQIGQSASHDALFTATQDQSALVKGVARAALTQLK